MQEWLIVIFGYNRKRIVSGVTFLHILYQTTNRLRTTLTHERLSNLAIMSIEYDILRELDFNNLVKDFAAQKARKVPGLSMNV